MILLPLLAAAAFDLAPSRVDRTRRGEVLRLRLLRQGGVRQIVEVEERAVVKEQRDCAVAF